MSEIYARSEGTGTGTGTIGEDLEISRLNRCLINTRRGITFLISHIGLVSLVAGYCTLGAILFEQLERDYELEVKQNMTRTRIKLGNNIWKLTNNSLLLHKEVWIHNVTAMMTGFEKELLTAMKIRGWDGSEDMNKRKWTLAGSLFYSIIIISTIGYGDQTPKTQWGKIATIFYSILGIPLFMLCLFNIGDSMANMFRFLYWRVCCALCTTRKKVKRKCRTSIRTPTGSRTGPRHSLKFRDNISLGGRSPRLSRRVGSITAEDIISFTVSNYDALDTADNGEDNVWNARDSLKVCEEMCKDSSDLAPTGTDVQNTQLNADEVFKPQNLGTESDIRSSRKSNHSSKSLTLPLNNQLDESSSSSYDLSKVSTPARGAGSVVTTPSRTARLTGGEFFHEFEYEDWEEVDVTKPIPIWICFFLVFSYICMGAFLFSGWEGWQFLDSWYFCFITLATIGFGDFVPKKSHETNKTLGELGISGSYADLVSIVINSFYLMLGMALVTTTFHLLGEEVKNKVRNVATKLGILKSEEDDFLD
ncbi:uncharacterized protein LOC111703223 isoform X2 [Eurytemora carolleeae]|uniref:uncharacterized protein LOC111703223 isoform X2 n=1 Tax=Eurytemora carolleeae TaxID=1294199 RepID=UPI000C7826A1|nr:uncharacterized protein LOC111703223 isoform X2 [Eurytemora carolleeae]|eukprot:XP_023330875.1 uncharacterized protein LOC111703223 isoform X2 [Eurytemora affinis]